MTARPGLEPEWHHRADDVDADAWALGRRDLFFSQPWLALNERDLVKSAHYLVLRAGAHPQSLTPWFEVDVESFVYYSPCAQLAVVLRDSGETSLAEAFERRVGHGGLVALVPASDVSPLCATPIEHLAATIDAAEREARRRGLPVVAFHNLGEHDGAAIAMLKRAGFRTAVLDGTFVIDVDPAWRTFDDYVGATRRDFGRERRRFLQRGNVVAWHDRIDGALVERIAPLNLAHHLRKGNAFTLDQVRAYFTSLPHELGPAVMIATCDGTDVGFLLAFPEPDRLRVHEVSALPDRDDFAYFNLVFYEPIVHAIAHGQRIVELGPGATLAKRARTTRLRPLITAFRFLGDSLDDIWPKISDVLARRISSLVAAR